MKYGILVLLATILSCCTFGQDVGRFKNFHGLKDSNGEGIFLEAEGYDIFIQPLDFGLDSAGIKRIKKEYAVKVVEIVSDSTLSRDNKILLATEDKKGVKIYLAYYLLPQSEQRTVVIGFARLQSRDVSLEHDFVRAYLSENIPSSVYTDVKIDSVDFIGRMIRMGSMCHWMAPHNIQCPSFGQLNWAVFDSLKQAEMYRDAKYESNSKKGVLKILTEKWVPVRLEGIETQALKTVVKFKVPKFIMGGSNVLTVYYVTTEIRQKYVTCIFSHYADDVNGNELPPLLAEFLSVQAADGSWREDQLSISQVAARRDTLSSVDEVADNSSMTASPRIEAGVWIPVGKLSSKMSISPELGLWCDFQFRKYSTIRLTVGTSIFFPQNSKNFTYEVSDSTLSVKAKGISGVVGLQISKTISLPDKAWIDDLDFYSGIGFGFIQTDGQKPKKNSDDTDYYYYLQSLQLSGGITLWKMVSHSKSIGLTLRYNLMPPTWFSSHVDETFGSSSFTTSFQFRF